MMSVSPEATVKSQARLTLKENWPAAITTLLIAAIPLCIIDCATTMSSCLVGMLIDNADLKLILVYAIGIPLEVILGIFLSPVINGYVRAYYIAAKTGKMDVSDAFYYFRSGAYASALALNLSLFIRLIIPALLFFSPQIAFQVLYATIWKDAFSSTILYNDVFFILTVLSSAAFTLYALRYFTVYAVSIDTEPSSNKEIFQTNRRIMKGRTISGARLLISFIPWLLLCLLVLPMLYVIPYLTQSLCISAKWIKEAYSYSAEKEAYSYSADYGLTYPR